MSDPLAPPAPPTRFPNLAGVECDAEILAELCAASIPAGDDPAEQRFREPITRYGGRLAGWTFSRAWYYWTAHGPALSLDVALPLHATWGTSVRAGGDCACRPPVAEGWPDTAVYHIDTAEGLAAFARLLREWVPAVVPAPSPAPDLAAIRKRADGARVLLDEIIENFNTRNKPSGEAIGRWLDQYRHLPDTDELTELRLTVARQAAEIERLRADVEAENMGAKAEQARLNDAVREAQDRAVNAELLFDLWQRTITHALGMDTRSSLAEVEPVLARLRTRPGALAMSVLDAVRAHHEAQAALDVVEAEEEAEPTPETREILETSATAVCETFAARTEAIRQWADVGFVTPGPGRGHVYNDDGACIRCHNPDPPTRGECPAPPDGLTHDQIDAALRNIGQDPTCGACMETFYTGATTNAHTCERRHEPPIVVTA